MQYVVNFFVVAVLLGLMVVWALLGDYCASLGKNYLLAYIFFSLCAFSSAAMTALQETLGG